MHAAERPPQKKQRLSDQLSSPLIHSPSPANTPTLRHVNNALAEANRSSGSVSKAGGSASPAVHSGSNMENKENRTAGESTGKTSQKSDGQEQEQEQEQEEQEQEQEQGEYEYEYENDNDNENEYENEYVNQPSSNRQHDSVLAGSSDSLSPVKSTKLGITSSAAAAATAADTADDATGVGSQPSFKQLIARFHHIVKDNNREASPDYDARGPTQDQDYEESEAEGEEEPSTELLVFNNGLSTLKNKYQSTINTLQVKVHENTATINSLNNQIGDYRSKIENLHLTVQQSQLDAQALADKNDIMQDELTILQSKIAKLDKQLVLEKTKKSKLSAQITQLSELLETVFKGYESMHATVSDLRQENTDLHQSVSQYETRIAAFDDTLKSELESLAQELYIQYAEKHEAKIAKLRAAYESKYAKKQATFRDRFQLLQDQQETLKQELTHVKNRLQVETSEKRQLVKLWDEYVALDKKDVDEMSNFVKRLK